MKLSEALSQVQGSQSKISLQDALKQVNPVYAHKVQIQKAQDEAAKYQAEADRLNSMSSLIWETAKGTGKGLLDFGKSVLRMPVTVPMKVTQTLAEAMGKTPQPYIPQTGVEKFVYGDQPIQSYTQDANSISKMASGYGAGTKTSAAIGAAGASAEVAMDLLLPGSGKILAKTFVGRALKGIIGESKVVVPTVDAIKTITKVEQTVGRNLDTTEKTAVEAALSSGNTEDNIISTISKEKPSVTKSVAKEPLDATSVASYIDSNGVKVVTPLSKRELAILADEIRTIPAAKEGMSQIHLDAKTPVLSDAIKSGEVKQISRDAFLAGHPQAKEAFANIPEVKPLTITESKAKAEIPAGKVSGYAKSLEEKAIEKDMATQFKDLAEYTPSVRKEQAKIATTMINEDIARVNRILNGTEKLPDGLRGSSLALAVERHAINNNDVKLIEELAKSKLSTHISESGSELSMLVGRNKNSPVRIIKDILRARNENVLKRLKGKKISEARKISRDSLKKYIKKEAPTKETWANFIKEIEC